MAQLQTAGCYRIFSHQLLFAKYKTMIIVCIKQINSLILLNEHRWNHSSSWFLKLKELEVIRHDKCIHLFLKTSFDPEIVEYYFILKNCSKCNCHKFGLSLFQSCLGMLYSTVKQNEFVIVHQNNQAISNID